MNDIQHDCRLDATYPQMQQSQKIIASKQTCHHDLKNDIFVSKDKKHSNKSNNMLLFSGLGVAALSTFMIIKIHNTRKLKKAHQIFKDVFMNDNITMDETKLILQRYKNLEKIKDKDEYITAIFDETKKNFGLGKELKLELEELPISTIGGGNFSLTDTIVLNKNWSRKKLENAVFHELRHAKQDYFAINYDVDKFLQCNNVLEIDEKNHILPFLQRKCGLETFSKKNVPVKYYNFVENCLKGYSDYQTIRFMPESSKRYKLYRDNFLEKDAWENANKITKFLYNFELK